jgi:transcription elongation GreA/GreB family factor
MVDEETIVITETDRARLQDMIDALEFVGDPFRGHIRELESELRRALVVPSSTVDPDVATMNSRLRTRDLDTGECTNSRWFTTTSRTCSTENCRY